VNAKGALLTVPGSSDLYVHAYGGDIFLVGVAPDDEARDQAILAMRKVTGVDEVKGLVHLREEADPTQVLRDGYLENVAQLSLARYVLHKNSGVDIKAVHGELCIIGVVGTPAEALDLIQYVETTTGAHARSLLVIHDTSGPGRMETNQHYLLATREEMFRPQATVPQLAMGPTSGLPEPPRIAQVQDDDTETPAQRALWQKARIKCKERIQALARQEGNLQARTELLSLANQVVADQDLSLSDRLSVAAAQAQTPGARAKIKILLAGL